MTREEAIRLVRQQTTLTTPQLVPELTLHLAADAHGIFQTVDEVCGGKGWPPYWAFAWPGGQALARYVLDHPDHVRGKRVLDLGAGSGIAGIAAKRAGAQSVIAADPDPLAAVAISLNLATNGVAADIVDADLLGADPNAQIVLIGDLAYEPELAMRLTRFLEGAARRGIPVLLADRSTARRPPLDFEFAGEYAAPLTPLLEESHFERALLWKLKGLDRRRHAAC